jgi:hypothetical protein
MYSACHCDINTAKGSPRLTITMAFTIDFSMLEKSPARTKNSVIIDQIEVPIGAN